MRLRLLPVVLLGPALAACAEIQQRPAAVAPMPDARAAWEKLVSPADRARIDTLGSTWASALGAVPKWAQGQLAAEGPLVIPAGALDQPALPPGPYYCRLIRFGGRAGLATFKPDFCIVESRGEALSFTKQGGANLFGGWLFADTDRRQIFLGTFRARPGEPGAGYGRDAAHEVAGSVERVSPFRWRLSLTRAGRGAMLDVYELVPVTPRVPGAVPAVPG